MFAAFAYMSPQFEILFQPFRYIRKWIVRFTLSRKKGEQGMHASLEMQRQE